jgi:molybdate transport system substrate-binding protein
MRVSLLLLLCAALAQYVGAADEPAIAVAANLTRPMERIIEQYRTETGVAVRASFGSSGNFVRQIRQHAPFEVFVSANAGYVDLLAADGLTSGTAVTIARGRIGAFVPADSLLAGETTLDGVMKGLANGDYRRIAMANPEFAPFGVAAREALGRAGVWAIENGRVVLGENVAQAVQFTLAGGVDVGFIPWSFALEPDVAGRGRFFLIPEDWHAPLEQRATLLQRAGAEARHFLEFLQSPAAQAILEGQGHSIAGSR